MARRTVQPGVAVLKSRQERHEHTLKLESLGQLCNCSSESVCFACALKKREANRSSDAALRLQQLSYLKTLCAEALPETVSGLGSDNRTETTHKNCCV